MVVKTADDAGDRSFDLVRRCSEPSTSPSPVSVMGIRVFRTSRSSKKSGADSFLWCEYRRLILRLGRAIVLPVVFWPRGPPFSEGVPPKLSLPLESRVSMLCDVKLRDRGCVSPASAPSTFRLPLSACILPTEHVERERRLGRLARVPL